MQEQEQATSGQSHSRLPLTLYALTIFLSAFLLFQVQPIIGKIILPWFGGSAAVWTTCLLFFQIVLLLGYLYAHGVIRYVPAVWQPRLHLGLLLLSLLALHMIPSPALRPPGGAEPVGRILLVLSLCIGLPYFMLSTTSPLLQAWYDTYSRSAPEELQNDSDPQSLQQSLQQRQTFAYRLYALSNAGSLLALLSYPITIEPNLTLGQQATSWSVGYFCFVALAAFVAWRFRTGATIVQKSTVQNSDAEKSDTQKSKKEANPDTSISEVTPSGPPPSPFLMLFWVFLAACSSTLLLAISNHLSQNVAAMPFLWVLPLGLYLLSFIWCFGGGEWKWNKAFLPLPFAFIAAMIFALGPEDQNPDIRVLIPLFAGGLFICCVVCHGELARLKPDPRYLTLFYLMLSVGGALGGIFVAVIAPHLFPAEYELPLAIAACLLVALFSLYREESCTRWDFSFVGDVSWLLLAILSVGLLTLSVVHIRDWQNRYAITRRNFYGVLRIQDTEMNNEPLERPYTDTDDIIRTLVYGTIQHGNQYLDPDKRRTHLSYYGADTGVGLAIKARESSHPERVGVIGLGTGSIASYGRKGDVYRYYEINPLVREIALTKFYYLTECPAEIDVVMGDARLSLETGTPQNFDVLAVDAFSSDAIPIHLLTKEAFDVYFRNLKPDGILAVHVSNRYLQLGPVVAKIAQLIGKQAKVIETSEDNAHDLSATEWVLVAAKPGLFDTPPFQKVVKDIEIKPKNLRLWTDDYSNLYQILRAFNSGS